MLSTETHQTKKLKVSGIMNLAKSKVVLKKINTLYESLELGDDISKIEKDLLLDYVKELYECVLDLPSKKDKKGKKSLENRIKKKEKREDSFEPIPTAKIEIAEVADIEEDEDQMELVEAEPESYKSSMKTSNTNGFHIDTKTPITEKPVEKPKPVTPSVSPEIERLFDPSILNQSAYRFSQTRIKDITKAMGINEKLLMINLLFNKDQQDFNYVASKLNYFDSFEEASKYLKLEVASKYEWGHVDKKEKAIEFIKLIKRKYVS